MFDTEALIDELQALKNDVSRLVQTTGEGIFDASKSRAETLADQIKAALNELGHTAEHLAAGRLRSLSRSSPWVGVTIICRPQ